MPVAALSEHKVAWVVLLANIQLPIQVKRMHVLVVPELLCSERQLLAACF
jgi:hypothetical protein